MSNLPPLPRYTYLTYIPTLTPIYSRDTDHANTLIDMHIPLTYPPAVLGFDIEWRPNFVRGQPENPAALVQLASPTVILLLQLSSMSIFPTALARVLADACIVKAGVGIEGDVEKLYRDWDVSPINNCVNLNLLARSVDNETWKGSYTKNPVGLARLIAHYEGKMLLKGNITRSNWEALLTQSQIDYASNDAHAGLVLFIRLEQMIPLAPSLQPKYYSFDMFRGRLFEPTSSIPWVPANPNYDPGPPPPPPTPEVLAARKAKQEERLARRNMRGRGRGNYSSRGRVTMLN